ncbi:unnamed protein product [Larinioides sclopetarius]|uniref:CCHC-type domain-containing protein n=1 Tax=Larinioides sclopetarius TaxID=280406 RepID=A0AAV2AQZ5_9ARAC
MYPLNPQEIRGFVYWLPNSVTNDQLKEHLQLYGDVLFVESQERNVRGRKVESDQRYYGLILPYGTIKDDLPHFLKINGFLCLVVVRGREPACYHCKEVGHRRIECPKYKEKLNSYCNREKKTAPPRLRSRGKRHVVTKPEVQFETSGNEVSSSDDIVCLEGGISVAELITEPPLSASKYQECVIEAGEEATGSSENELTESYIFSQRSNIDSSVASFSEIQIKDVLETIQQIQRRTKEDLQQRLKYFEKEIALSFTREALSTHIRDERRSIAAEEATYKNLDQEMGNEELEMQTKENYILEESTPIEMGEEDSSADIGIKETVDAETLSDLPSLRQVKVGTVETVENIYKISEENPKYFQSSESTAEYSTSNTDTTSSVLLMLKKTKQAASETLENTFNKLVEFAEGIEAIGKSSTDSATNKDFKLSEDDVRDLLGMLEQAKTIAMQDSVETLKKIEAHLSTQPSSESINMEAKLNEDTCFSKQMLENTKENFTEILQNTFKRLKEKIIKAAEQSKIAIESADESKTIPKIANIAAQSKTTFEQEVIDTVKYVCKEGMEDAVESESNQKAPTLDERSEKTIQSESGLVTKVHDDFEEIEIYEHSEQIKQVTTEKTFSASKEVESNVYKTSQEDIDKLQTNLKEIFASVQVKTELFPETRMILKQVESKVIEMVKETTNRWEVDF